MSIKNQDEMNFTNIGIAILFMILIIGVGFAQIGLKENPQRIMIGFGMITLILKFFKQEKVSTILFSFLIGVLLCVVIFIGIEFFVHKLNPNAGWVEVDGKKRRVMDMNWVWGILGGIIISPIITIKYYKSVNKNKILELIFLILFIIVTTIIYFFY